MNKETEDARFRKAASYFVNGIADMTLSYTSKNPRSAQRWRVDAEDDFEECFRALFGNVGPMVIKKNETPPKTD